MISNDPVISKPVAFSHPPPKRARISFCTRVGNFFSRVVANSNKIARSLLGKAVIYSIADTVGAVAGNVVGGTVLGKVGAKIGSCFASEEILGTFVGTTLIAHSCFRLSKIQRAGLMAMSVATIVFIRMTSFDERQNHGAWAGEFIGQGIGSFVGTILGGYSCLRLVNSPTVFLDQENLWDSYSTSTARFLVVGMLFESTIVRPSTPLIGPFLCLPRKLIGMTLQSFAYNSNKLIPIVQASLQNKKLAKPILPTMVGMAINTYCGHNQAFFEQKLSGYSLNKLFPFLAKNQFDLAKKLDRFLPKVLMSKINHIAENSDMMLSVAIKAFHDYANLLADSKELIEAHQRFRDAFFNQSTELMKCKQQVAQMTREKVLASDSSSFWKEVIQSVIDYSWTTDHVQQFMKKLDVMIKEMEVSLVGFPLTHQRHTAYLAEILEVHLQHYFIFLLIKYHELEGLTSQQEYESFNILIHLIFTHYMSSMIPKRIANASHKVISYALRTTFKIQNVIAFFFRQPEHRSFILPSEKVAFIENYAQPELKQINTPISLTIMDNYIPSPLTSATSSMIHSQESDFVLI